MRAADRDLPRRAGRSAGAARSPVPAIDQGEVLEDERHADRGDQRGEPRGVAERPVDEPLDRRR